MPQPLKLKKLKLNGSMRTNETFQNEHQKKDVPFITGDWNVKIGSQDTWSNMQVWPWSTK